MSPLLEVPQLINPQHWQDAQWLGAAFLAPADGPPGLGVVFGNRLAGLEIFAGWRRDLGARDEDELIRTCILLGDIPGQSRGYTMHFSFDLEAFTRKVAARGDGVSMNVAAPNGHAARRMENPNGAPPHLLTFREMVEAKGEYSLTPVVRGAEGFEPLYAEQLLKRAILFRTPEEIVGDDDPDAPLLHAS